jgi:hypothetical protein
MEQFGLNFSEEKKQTKEKTKLLVIFRSKSLTRSWSDTLADSCSFLLSIERNKLEEYLNTGT